MLQLSDQFAESAAPGTGRRVLQLTTGDATCYPLYYFIPSFSSDGRFLVYHRAEDGQIQLHCLDLTTGKSIQLTHAHSAETQWIPWCVASGSGVLDHRSVLNQARDEVIYFGGNDVRCVDLQGVLDRLLFRLPEDRVAIGQNCVTTDGQWFVYIHHDREGFERVYAERAGRQASRGTVLAAYHLKTGEHRNLVIINSPIHHVVPYDDEHVIFCHPTTENGMLLTNVTGGWFSHLRTQDERGGCVCHYLATEAGIAYEVLGRADGVWSGIYNPFAHRRYEFAMPEYFGYTHTGSDPQGKLWVYENSTRDVHDMHFLAEHQPDGQDRWVALTGDWPTYGGGQKSHFHPQVTPDRQWILFTGGDPRTETNHLFLLDISDLESTQGMPDVLSDS